MFKLIIMRQTLSESVKLSDVVEIVLGQTFRVKAESSDSSSEIKLIQIRDIVDACIDNIENLPYANLSVDKLKIKIQQNDLLLPLRGNKFRASLFTCDFLNAPVTTTNQIAILRSISDRIDIKYILWYFNSISGRNALAQISKGATIPSINRSELSAIEIPIPSLQKQLKIVDIYFNWLEQTKVLKEMLINGEKLAEQHCLDLSLRKES